MLWHIIIVEPRFTVTSLVRSLLQYSGTSVYGHLTSMVTSPIRSSMFSPKLFPKVQRIGLPVISLPSNTSPLKSLLLSVNSQVPLYCELVYMKPVFRSLITCNELM